MSAFNLDVPIIQALIAGSSCAGVVDCATAWLAAYERADQRGVGHESALVEAAEAWDCKAAEWRAGLSKTEQASTS